MIFNVIKDIQLDHVATAVENWEDAWPTVVGVLGGKWKSGGFNLGFAPAQLSFANDMRIEVLMPSDVEHNDFLRRFLDHSGPGPHHLTFKVHDIEAALDEVRSAGFEPTGVSIGNPWWKEAFIHPKQALGVVVQIAQSAGSWFVPPPKGVPMPKEGVNSELLWVGHAVSDINRGLELFRDLLGGTELASGSCDDGSSNWIELSWKGPGRIRLIAKNPDSEVKSPVEDWLKGRSGRICHLAFGVQDLQSSEGLHESGLPGMPDGAQVLGVSEALNLPVIIVRAKGN
ncbi:MAG: hypothetical protein HKL80_04275 [Acidimicrobiales bacterium]|nr:hypothetical protein [Acidimicrobiales bacterium]